MKDDQLSKQFWFSIVVFDEIVVKGSTCLTFSDSSTVERL